MEQALTPEQMKQIAEYVRMHNPAKPYGADVGGMEDMSTMQQQMGAGLQGAAPPAPVRNDWGSNLGRAGMGVAGALRNYQAGTAAAEASTARKAMAADEKARLAKRAALGGVEELGGEKY